MGNGTQGHSTLMPVFTGACWPKERSPLKSSEGNLAAGISSGGYSSKVVMFWSQSDSIQITALPLTISVSLSKLLKLSVPQFYLENAVMNGAT